MKPCTIGIVIFFILGLLSAPLPTSAQQPGKLYHIGFLYPGSASSGKSNFKAFWQGLREYGWVEGENVAVTYRYAEGQYQRFPAMAQELVRLKVDLIVVATTPGTRAAVQATTTIPIVFILVADPIGSGFVGSLARSGGNATGTSYMAPELTGKQLEMLTEVKPELSHVGFLGDSNNPAIVKTFEQMQRDATQLGLTIRFLEVSSHNELKQAFAEITRERIEALFVHLGVFMRRHRKEIAEFARRNQILTMTNSKTLLRNGLLMSYAPHYSAGFRQIAPYIDKILKGANPADLPVERPMKFELGLNLKTAKTIGITFPPMLLVQATEVIQ